MKPTFVILAFLCVILPLASALPQPHSHTDYSPLMQKYRAVLTSEMMQYHDAGMSIALVDGDSTVWCEGFGYYSQQQRKPVTGHTPFHIGSICKTFTGLAVMMLQEDKKINIDHPFKRYVPAFALRSRFGPAEAITVRQILTHHAGIPDFIKDKFAIRPSPYTKVLEYVNDDYATFAPNTVFSYSNAGFALLGNLIESVTDTDYFHFIRRRLLDPMEMHETGFVIDDNVPESVHLGYTGHGEEEAELAIVDAPAGCIYSTAWDMAKYIRAHLQWGKFNSRQVFDSTTLASMMQVQNDSVFLDFGSPYGIAWRLYDNDAGRSIQHDGGTMYHRAELSISPECGLGVVMLSNSASGKPLLHADYDILNEACRLKGAVPRARAKNPVKNFRHPDHDFVFHEGSNKSIRILQKGRTELDRYAGTYGSFGMYLKIIPDGNALAVNMMGQRFYLLPTDVDEFVPAGQNDTRTIRPTERYYFERVNNGLVIIQIDKWGNHSLLAERLPESVLAAPWDTRLGSYMHDGVNEYQLFSDLKLVSEDGLLLLKAKLNIELGGGSGTDLTIPLKVIDDNDAVVAGYGRFSGQTLQFMNTGAGREVMRFMAFKCSLTQR